MDSKLEEIFRLDHKQKNALKKIKLFTVEDILYHFPTRYGDTAEIEAIQTLQKGDKAIIYGKVTGLKMSKAFRKKIPMAEAILDDGNAKIKLIWFHQPYIAKLIKDEGFVKVEGTVSERNGILYMPNPEIVMLPKLPIAVGKSLFGKDEETFHLHPVYPETRGITSNWIQHTIKKILQSGILDKIDDTIPDSILAKYNLPKLKSAIVWIHFPKKERDANSARKRFAFEEIFFIQIEKYLEKINWQTKNGFNIETSPEIVNQFIERFKFSPTNAQLKSINQILDDFKKGFPMSRLLEGDVGSGKTAVAATVAFAVAMSKPLGQDFGNLQVAYMAPTEILAKQHFVSFIELFSHLPIKIGLLTGSGCYIYPSKEDETKPTSISRGQLLKWVANGEIPILIGTHSLIQKSIKFKHLALVIIDEQHRFGTHQRKSLVQRIPHKLPETQTAQNKNNEVLIAPSNKLSQRDIIYIIRSIANSLYKELGNNREQSDYSVAVNRELVKREISITKGIEIDVFYRNKKIRTYQPNFILEGAVILEIRTTKQISPSDKKEFDIEVRGGPYKLSLLVNFGQKKVELYEVCNEVSSTNQKKSLETDVVVTPHLLSMTATPIPRTLALTIYGDLNISLLDELPKGRKPIDTEIVLPSMRNEAYKKIRKELQAKRQVYIICPRIDEPDPTKAQAILVKSVKEEAKRLKRAVFVEYEIGILHSKMTTKEKDSVMERFKQGEINILVATSVIEVGVNIPNATVIIIEGAERFGLAQLHQLRGRVLRSNHKPYCYIFTDSSSEKTLARLKALKESKSGFDLAEQDLKLRGAGELYGGKQWGITDIGMEAIRNLKMVEAARTEAEKISSEGVELKNYPLIKEKLEGHKSKVHFE